MDWFETLTGFHETVAVTDVEGDRLPLVSQAFCSALPAAYTPVPSVRWKPFASLVLDAAYEATMLAAILNKKRGATNIVLLTLLGGGAFGNDIAWIRAAIRRAFKMMSGYELDARIVSYGDPPPEIEQIAWEFG